jgi:hypothetical protein
MEMTYAQSFNGSLLEKPLGGVFLGMANKNAYYTIAPAAGPEILVIMAPDGTSRWYTD